MRRLGKLAVAALAVAASLFAAKAASADPIGYSTINSTFTGTGTILNTPTIDTDLINGVTLTYTADVGGTASAGSTFDFGSFLLTGTPGALGANFATETFNLALAISSPLGGATDFAHLAGSVTTINNVVLLSFNTNPIVITSAGTNYIFSIDGINGSTTLRVPLNDSSHPTSITGILSETPAAPTTPLPTAAYGGAFLCGLGLIPGIRRRRSLMA